MGLEQDQLQDAFITLLDAQELAPPPPKIMKTVPNTKVGTELIITLSERFDERSIKKIAEQIELLIFNYKTLPCSKKTL